MVGTNFRKGESVFRVKTWDNKGTFSIERCIVDSAGKKQIHLRGSNGEMRKHRESVAHLFDGFYNTFLFREDHESVVELIAKTLAEGFVADSISRTQASLRRHRDTGRNDEGYIRALRATIQEMHEPRVHWVRA